MKKTSPRRASQQTPIGPPLIAILTTLTILLFVAILLLVIQGYRFNRFDGKLEQGGLLQYDSRPNGADVYVDSARLANKTANKITVSAGKHTIRMTKAGYNDWTKEVTVKPGTILWLNYTRMIPQTKKIDTIATASDVASAAVSTNQKYIAFKDDQTTPTLNLATIDSDTPKIEKITYTADSYTTPADPKNQAFAIQTWDDDNRYVLVRHTYDTDKSEWLVVDTHGGQATLNVTTSIGIAADHAEFALGNSRVLYALTSAGDIRRLDLNARTISAPIVTNVAEFSQYDRSTLAYVTKIDESTKKRTAGYITNGASKSRALKTYADLGDTSLHLRIGRYFNQTYVAVAYGETLDITTGDLPSSDSESTSALTPVASLTIPGGADTLAFSPGAERFVYAETTDSISVYDLELDMLDTTKVDNANGRAIQWVDREHFVTTTNDLAIYDFDGTNRQKLASSSVALPVVISPNNKYLFTFTKDDRGVYLQRIKLTVD